jgi:hypothetical protein
MTADMYIRRIINKYKVLIGQNSAASRAAISVIPKIRKWAGTQLRNVKISGSYSKGTAIRGRTDIDLFISLKSNTDETLKNIFYKLHRSMVSNGYAGVRRQNVSIHLRHLGIDIDLVPGVKLPSNTEDHWLYISKSGKERIKTNINKHIALVKNSNRLNEIRAIKIWSKLHDLDFPSFYLELAVITALRGYRYNRLADNTWRVFDYLSNNFISARFVDPANSNNIVSNELNSTEKYKIATQAISSMQEQYWRDIIW